MKYKISIIDKRIRQKFYASFSIIITVVSFLLIFDFVPKKYNWIIALASFVFLFARYIYIWNKYNTLKEIKIRIDNSDVIIKSGDLFKQEGYKVIAFNEYFDTTVDNKIISENSINGVFINRLFPEKNTEEFDEFIKESCDKENILSENVVRKKGGKIIKYKISTSFVYEDFILTAFTKFDDNNKANLTMPEYVEFLINFWDKVNDLYAQKCVSVPIFGSGITHIKEHKNISDEELLEIMLWTYKISEYRFRYPAILTIVIHEAKINQINLLNFKSIENG